MKANLLLRIAGILLAGALPCVAQATVQFTTNTYYTVESAGSAALIVQRTGDTNSVVSVDYATANGSATNGLDYVTTNGTLVFAAGETLRTIVVPVLNDSLVESTTPETFSTTLSHPTNAVLGTRTFVYTRIIDNDKALQWELASNPVNEDAGAITLRAVRWDDSNPAISVDYFTGNMSAMAGQDYEAAAGTLNFAAGQTVKQVAVTLLNDAAFEFNESFRITLTNLTGGGVLSASPSTIVTITNTDELVQFQAAKFAVREDAAIARIPVLRGESALTTTVDVSSTNGTALAGQDFVGLTNTLTFAPGERLKFVDVPILNDGLAETNETFQLTLSNPTGGAVLGAVKTVTVTVLDNDPGVSFERSTNSVWERQPGLTLNVVRGNDAWLGPFTVDYQTADGTALAGVDYQAASGTLSFAANEMVKGISLLLLTNPAPDTARSFMVALANATGGIPLGVSTSLVSIVDAAQGKVDFTQLPLRAAAGQDGNLLQVSWPGSAQVLRADSPAGPWEQLGVFDNPLLTAPSLPGAYYQLRSPRFAQLYVPSSYDGQTPLPLVVALHGYSGDAVQMLDYMRLEPLAESRGFLLLTPEGTPDYRGWRFWNAAEACCNFYGSTVDDSGYLRELIESLAGQFAVDRKRIHVTGESNGGYMSHRMARDHADLIASIASLAGLTLLDASTHRPSQPVHVLQIHGTADAIVPYAGGALLAGLPVVALSPGAVATVQMWAEFNGCQGPQWDFEPTMDLDLDVPGRDSSVMRYTNAPPGGAVELWTIHGGIHGPTLFRGSDSTEYSARVIDWLLAHPKP